MTTRGRARELVLSDLAGAVETADHPYVRADLARCEIEFGQGFTVRLSKRSSNDAWSKTSFFDLSYVGRTTVEPFEEALLDRLRAEVESREIDVEWRRLLLDRELFEIEFHSKALRVELRPSLACNHRCGFCNSVDWRTTANAGAGIDALLEELDNISALPAVTAAISGGEPTLLKRLPELVGRLASEGLSVELQTNGMSLAEPGYARELRDRGVVVVLVSLHSANATISDGEITHFPGGWEKTVAGIDAALDAGLRVHISHVMHKQNVDGTADFMRFVADRWGRQVVIRLAYVAPAGEAVTNFDKHIPRIEDVIDDVREGLAEAKRRRLRVKFVAFCGLPPCLLRPFEGFSDVTTTLGAVDYGDQHTKLPACEGCKYVGRCPGLWRSYLDRFGDPGVRPF